MENRDNIQIYPPIIDNTIGAFPISFEDIDNSQEKRSKGDLKIQFYFQIPTVEDAIRKDIVLVNASVGGESILKGKYQIKHCTPPQNTDFLTIKDYADKEMYSIILNEKDLKEGFQFKINTPISLYLATIATDAQIDETNIQSWYENNPKSYSSWSDGAIKYAITQPTFQIWGGLSAEDIVAPEVFHPQEGDSRELKPNKDNNQYFSQNVYRIRGKLSFALNEANTNIPEDDVLLWYQIQFYKNGSRQDMPSTGGRAYPNRFWDINNREFYYEFAEDTFSNFTDGEKVEMAVLYATNKGYKETFIYPITVASNNSQEIIDSELAWEKASIDTSPNEQKGCITIRADLRNSKDLAAGIFYVQRAIDNGNGVLNFKTIYKENRILPGRTATAFVYEDFSAEAGIFYQYKIFFRHEALDNNLQPQLKYSPSIFTNKPVLLLIEDMFLITNGIKLKIRYNPELTSFKRNVQDIITPTLGGAYPFVRRNGAQIYKTFTIGGLISYHGEESEWGIDWLPHIMDHDSLTLSNKSLLIPDIFSSSMFMPLKDLLEDTFPQIPENLSYYDKERIKEKLFRDKVMDFLYSGEVMLFKSLQEGNCFIKLTNISFSSNKQLDRNIYSFTAQAVEVMAPSEENYARFFSPLESISNFILTRVYMDADGITKTATDITTLLNVSVPGLNITESALVGTYNIIKSTIEFKTTDGFTKEINSDNTYIDKFGRVVPIINGHFAPGRFPEIQIANYTKTVENIKDVEKAPVYRQTYEFNDD